MDCVALPRLSCNVTYLLLSDTARTPLLAGTRAADKHDTHHDNEEASTVYGTAPLSAAVHLQVQHACIPVRHRTAHVRQERMRQRIKYTSH
jgi:hypothetical protein